MRLRTIAIDEFRSLAHLSIDPDGLVVLFGANSSGKTTVIDAVRELLGGALEMRRDPYGEDTGDPFVDGWVIFELVGLDLEGHPDRELYRRLFTGELSKDDAEWPWRFIEEGTATLLGDLDIDEAQDFIAHSYAEMPGPGSREDRLLLANELIRTRFFKSSWDGTWLVAFPDELSAAAREAAGRIVAMSDGTSDDFLLEDATAIFEGRLALVSGVADGFVESDEIRAAFGGFVDVDAEVAGLADSAQNDIIAIHDAMWALPQLPRAATGAGWHLRTVDGFLLEGAGRYAGSYKIDTWLEVEGEEPEPRFDLATDAATALRWHRVRPSVIAVAQLLEQRANELAPSFVQELGRIRVEILPPVLWHEEPSRLRISFMDGKTRRDLSVLGAGVARWTATAVRLAGQELRSAHRVVVDQSGQELFDHESLKAAVESARRDPLNQSAVELSVRSPTTPITYLADEPEAHLHPRAVASIGDWLCDLVERGHQALVATHNPSLLTQLGDRARLLLVVKQAGRTRLRDVSGNLQGELEHVNAALGLTSGELLLMTRLALFVEGPHDQAVLLGMFADELAAAGVKVFPLHGVDNALALVESEVIAALGVRMAVLTDNVDRERIGQGEARTHEERATLRLLKEANLSGKSVSPFGLHERDIVEYLDEEVCRSVAPSFPGWHQAARIWNDAGRPMPFKAYVTDQFDLRLHRDAVYELSVATALSGRVPAEIAVVVRSICARAASA